MRLEYILLADGANLSQEGKLNVLGAFDQILAARFPVVHPQMTLIVKMVAAPPERGSKKAVAIELLDEDGAMLARVDAETEVPDEPASLSPTMTLLLNVQSLVLPKAGTYTFHVLVNGEPKGDRPFRVGLAPDGQPG